MNIQYASDLHFEMVTDPDYIGVDPAPGAEVLVLAGDIGVGTDGIARFLDWPVPVIYVHGNHELYGCEDMGRGIADLRTFCAGTNVHFLEKDAVVINGVRFLGTALWTDYGLDGPGQMLDNAMFWANAYMNDMRFIKTQGRKMQAADFAARHATSREWLEDQLATPFAGKTVVVTHHAPDGKSVPIGTKPTDLRPCYASALAPMVNILRPPSVWIHGHVHRTVGYPLYQTRVRANPRGYPDTGILSLGSTVPVFKNITFDPQKTVAV